MKRIVSIILTIAILSDIFTPLLVLAAGDIAIGSCTASNYKVSVVSASKTTDLACYSSYSSAKSAMLSYNSDASNVAVIYHDNRIVNATYAIAKMDIKSDDGVSTYIYPSLTSNSKYTSVAGWYGSDAAFIDYDESGTYKRAKVKISGYVGWVDIDEIQVKPISLISNKNITVNVDIGLKLRSEPTTKVDNRIAGIPYGITLTYQGDPVQAEGYTWYKVTYAGKTGWIASVDDWVILGSGLLTYYEVFADSGNLIHYFDTRVAGQSYTNLAKPPGFMKLGVKYYSFDGNYFYSSITTMLNDYRNNNYNNAINKTAPYYSYFMYLPTRTMTGYTAADFDSIIRGKGYTAKPNPDIAYYDPNNGNKLIDPIPANLSVLVGTGALFINGQNSYGTNALLAFSAALNESGGGRNSISFVKNNIFSVRAYDSCPFTCATTYPSIESAIQAYMSGNIALNYAEPTGEHYYGSHYGNKASGRNVDYATDPYWGEKMAANYYSIDRKLLSKEFNSSKIGIKQTDAEVKVQRKPNTSSEETIYTMRHDYGTSIKRVSNMSVVILGSTRGESINGNDIWYKIQSDVALDAVGNVVTDGTYNYTTSVGYVHSSYIYSVKDNAPIINAINHTVITGDSFDLMSGVKATDVEDGDLTPHIIVEGTVDFNTVNTYKVTYKVTDSSGNTSSKTIDVVVTDQFESKAGLLIYDKLAWTADNKLDISGFTAVKGIDNSKDQNYIKHYLILKDTTGKEYSLSLSNWTSEYPFEVNNQDGKDYSGGWFKDSIDLSSIPQGDYDLYIEVQNGVNKSREVLRNLAFKDMIRKASDSSGRGYMFKVNYFNKTYPIQLFIRDEGLISNQTPPTIDNMFNTFFQVNLQNQMLHIRGTSYSINGDYKADALVERSIILENIDTYERHVYDNIGSIATGDYKIILRAPDGRDKTRAWYDANIDLSGLPKGRYAIYVRTKTTNIDDYGELYDIAFRDVKRSSILTDKTITINRNDNVRYRMEIVIE